MPRYKGSRGSKRSRAICSKNKGSVVVSPDVGRENSNLNDDSAFLANQMFDAAYIEVPKVLVDDETVPLLEHFDSEIKRSLLYEISKPVIESIVLMISNAVTTSGTQCRKTTWGNDRKIQFLEHVFSRVRASIDAKSGSKRSAENIDSLILDNAVAFIEGLSLSSVGGTNFTSNQYVRSKVLEALIPTATTSHRQIANRLKINRLSIPQIIIKRKEFDKIKCAVNNVPNIEAMVPEEVEKNDNIIVQDEELINGNESFAGPMNKEELGLFYLFQASGLDSDDNFLFEDDTNDSAVEPPKKIKRVNIYQKHLTQDKRKKRKDCPNYMSIVRSYTHDVFRIDTFAKGKVLVENENGQWEYHMQHVQNASIEDTHRNFLVSQQYKDWQYQNSWIKKGNSKNNKTDNDIIVLPSICLRLFFYAMCPCCQNPTQRDCADSLVVGFTHALLGIGKIRNSNYINKKQLIEECDCVYHTRILNMDMWKGTHNFMLAMLCAPVELEDFSNPALSEFSRKVIHNFYALILYKTNNQIRILCNTIRY